MSMFLINQSRGTLQTMNNQNADFKELNVIDKNSDIPAFYQVQNSLMEKLNHLSPNSKLPNEFELCQIFDVSRTTIRRVFLICVAVKT